MRNLVELMRHCDKQSGILKTMIPDINSSPLHKLKTILLEQNEIDDHTAMMMIYGKKRLNTFSKLKTKMKEILIKCILLQSKTSDSNDTRSYEFYQQSIEILVSRMLVDLKSYNLSIVIAEKTIKNSIKYQFTESVIILSRILIRHFGIYEFNIYKYEKYLEINKLYNKYLEYEIKAENYFIDLQRIQQQSLASPSELVIEKANHYVQELLSINDVKTITFLINRYRVMAILFEYQNSFNNILKISDNILNEIYSSKIISKTFIQNVNLRKSWAFIQTGRNNEAINLGFKGLNEIESGSIGWYLMAHYTIKALLYKGEYKSTIELITDMIENKKFQNISDNYKELFYTTLGYIHLIVASGLIGNPARHQEKLPPFKLYKFLNAVPVFSKDKRGINVSILLMHIAFLIQRKDYDAIIDRVDSLNHYAYRHLRKDDTFRSNCMIKMVIQMTKAGFNPIRTERYTEELFTRLKEVKLAGSGQNIETEIIPYEVLWDIMKRALKVETKSTRRVLG